MTGMSDWRTVEPLDPRSGERLVFTDHEWATVEAATARIMPTDHDPGAREARVVRFIDRYLSGLSYVFAAADGEGFLELAGKQADAWRERLSEMRQTYRDGIRSLDQITAERFDTDFKCATDAQQDEVLERLSGVPKPVDVCLGGRESTGTVQMGAFDDGLTFFEALVAHTRQGFYSDPVYGGNHQRVGWEVIGFPGPEALRDTMDGTYSLESYLVKDYDWHELIPDFRER